MAKSYVHEPVNRTVIPKEGNITPEGWWGRLGQQEGSGIPRCSWTNICLFIKKNVDFQAEEIVQCIGYLPCTRLTQVIPGNPKPLTAELRNYGTSPQWNTIQLLGGE